MSQSREKLNRRMDKLEVEMKQLRQAQVDSDRFAACLHAIRSQTEQDDLAQRRKTRKAIRSAERWQRTAWLAIVAMMLCGVLCLTIHVRADAAQFDMGNPISEQVEVTN